MKAIIFLAGFFLLGFMAGKVSEALRNLRNLQEIERGLRR